MIELNRIYNEDCLEGMKRIADKLDEMPTVISLKDGKTDAEQALKELQNKEGTV